MRSEFERGDLPAWPAPSPDLAVLLTIVRRNGRPLFGPPPAEILDAVPRGDLDRALLDVIPDLMAELDTDTRNVILTLARIWATLTTGDILPKDTAAKWAMARLPSELVADLGERGPRRGARLVGLLRVALRSLGVAREPR